MSDGPPIPEEERLSDEQREGLMADLEEIIASSHLFRTLDEEGRAELIRSGYIVRFRGGEALMAQDEEGETMYLLISGQVSVETQGSGRRGSIKLAVLGRGACLGEVAVLGGGRRTASVTALEDGSAVAFDKRHVQAVVDRYPRVRALLEAMIEGRARDTVEKLIGQ